MQALTHWSGDGLRTAARAGVYFVNDSSSDVNFPLSSGAVIFNLWHGVGLKNVLFGAKVGVSARLAGKRRLTGDNAWRFLRTDCDDSSEQRGTYRLSAHREVRRIIPR